MNPFDEATRQARDRLDTDPDQSTEPAAAGATARLDSQRATVDVAGESVPIEEPDTVKTDDDGTWLSGDNQYGRPRGRDAIEARQIVETSAMQAIGNGIVDQLLGGELAFESNSDDVDSTESEVRRLIRDVLTGPHLGGADLDDLITAAVFDMLGPGNAYWQLHPSADGDIPVVALSTLDALTIRHNVDRHGVPQDPPYWQAHGAFSGDGVAGLGSVDPAKLQAEQLAVMHYPRGHRSHSYYPESPALQVREWLEILTNSTTHHNRFYSDNKIPPGLIQVMQGSDQTVQNVKDKIQAASGDPRDVPVIGGDGGAQWLDLGGTAVNLNIIEEQRWFFNMCLGALGLGKHELGFTEDANRSNGEVEATRIYKRIAGPFSKQFQGAFTHVARQFDVYNALDDPFDIRLDFTDPREQHAREDRFRQQYQTGLRTFNDFQELVGNDPGEMDTTVEIADGVEIDYGDKPKPVVESLMIARRMEALNDGDGGGEETAEQMADAFDDQTATD
jgi:hypothetical protein